MNWPDIVWAFAWPPVYTFGCAVAVRVCSGATWRAALRPWFGRWLAGCGGVVLAGVFSWYFPEAGIGLVLAAAGVAVWWWLRRRRDRAPRTFGAKSRARLAALARKVREVTTPRPVLRPVPGGAR